MSGRQLLEQMERLAVVQDEMHQRLMNELREMQAAQEDIAAFHERSIELRNLRSAAIVEAAAALTEAETGTSILDLFRTVKPARMLQ